MHVAVNQRVRILAFTIALAVTAVGCASAAEGDVDAATGAPSATATIGFATPADGASVTVPFDVSLESSVPLGDPSTGDQHAHLYFDTTTDSADYDIVYGTDWQVTRELTPGEHTIIVAMANPDHSLAGPTQEIHVTVGAGAGVGTIAPPTGGTDHRS